MFRYLYSFLLLLALPLILMRLYLRGIKVPGYRERIGERFGHFNPPGHFDVGKTTIWVHAVSIGETVAAEPLIKTLRQTYPSAQILVTSMTPTGSDRVNMLFGKSVFHSYLPYDLPVAVNRFLKRINPLLLIIMETELWPNLIHQCKKRKIKILLANARLSEKSAMRYGRIPGTTKTMLQSLNAIAAQSEADGKRLKALGANVEQIVITGSLKFNVEQRPVSKIDEPFFNIVKESDRIVILAASTREGEEKKLLSTITEVHRNNSSVLFLIVPRHPERFDEVFNLLKQAGLKIQRRSQCKTLMKGIQVILGDSMGEMSTYYSVASIAFVGGSLVDTGCQNVLEPAAHLLPILVGPSQYNFVSICDQLEEAGGLQTVADETELSTVLNELVCNEIKRQQMGAAARSVIDANQQAMPTLMEMIGRLLS